MSISDEIKLKVRADFHHCCAYCRVAAKDIYAPMEIEHIQPTSKGGTDDELNLCLSCSRCNGFKGSKTEAKDSVSGQTATLFNPRLESWSEHFEWTSDDLATIVGRTSTGRATVVALKLNFPASVEFRRELVLRHRYPPKT